MQHLKTVLTLARSAISELEDQIRWKGNQLADLKKDIEKAIEHYKCLKLFLENLGVDPRLPRLTFNKELLLSQTASELELSATEKYPGSEF
jgi:regulator of replication initiation timing